MAQHVQPRTIPQKLEDIARDVHDLAFDFMEPARDLRDAEGRIARVEGLAERLRATMRGRKPDHHG